MELARRCVRPVATARVAGAMAAALGLGVAFLLPPAWFPRIGVGEAGAHILGFAALTGVATRAAPGRWVGLAAGLFAFGALLESAQLGIPAHGFEGRDLATNGLGIALGLGVVGLGRALAAGSRWLARNEVESPEATADAPPRPKSRG